MIRNSASEKPSEAEILERLEDNSCQNAVVATSVSLARTGCRCSACTEGSPSSYRHGRVLIAGDAGHTHAPFGGQGMLTGIGDVENLAWKLALVVDGGADAELLDTYEAERRPLATEVLRNTSAVTKLNIASSAIGRFFRDQIVARVFNLAAVQRWVTFQTSQLWVSYRHGPLAERTLSDKETPTWRPSRRLSVCRGRRQRHSSSCRATRALGTAGLGRGYARRHSAAPPRRSSEGPEPHRLRSVGDASHPPGRTPRLAWRSSRIAGPLAAARARTGTGAVTAARGRSTRSGTRYRHTRRGAGTVHRAWDRGYEHRTGG